MHLTHSLPCNHAALSNSATTDGRRAIIASRTWAEITDEITVEITVMVWTALC